MPEVVDWELAEKVAVRATGREPFAESYHYASLQPDFEQLTAQAEEPSPRRPACAAWRARPGPASPTAPAGCGPTRVVPAPAAARHRPARRAHGARAGRPDRSRTRRRRAGRAARLDVDPGARPVRPARDRGRGTRGAGHRLLRGPERARPREALRLPARGVPPVAGAARGHPPRQFTGVPWMREHFLGLVELTLGAVDPDPSCCSAGSRRAVDRVPRRAGTRSTTAASSALLAVARAARCARAGRAA